MIETKMVSNRIGGRGSCDPSFRGDIRADDKNDFPVGTVLINRVTGDAKVVYEHDGQGNVRTVRSAKLAAESSGRRVMVNISKDGRITPA